MIAGGGLAAQRCCEALRSRDYEGPITVVCAEPLAPYDRPPLSKDVLAGKRDPATLGFRPPDWYAERGIELLLGERAVALDAEAHRLRLESGASLAYDAALIATGSRPRNLPGLGGLSNAHTLRSVDDAERIRDGLLHGGPLVVIGAGFIGLEVAATARKLGVEVVVIEAAPAPLMRVLGPELGHWFADLHRAEEVEVLLSARISDFAESAGRIDAIELEGGRRIACGMVMVGVGIEPDTEWLEQSGFDPDGVRAYPNGRTMAPDVYAAGDAARIFNPATGDYERSEHWEAAAAQGAEVARAMLGIEPAPKALHSFWTDQYGIRVQTVGELREADELEFDGDPAERDFSAIAHRAGRPIGALIAGRPRALPELRRRIRAAADDEETSDEVLAANR